MEEKEFEKFDSIARWSRDVVVTEKIDGTNAQILIAEDGGFFTGSRKRWITPEDDNFGFSRWCHEHKEELIAELGFGRHYGEWWGCGIQRKYGIDEKRFSLLNVKKWEGHVGLCGVVPVLWRGPMDDLNIPLIMENLNHAGSYAADGFMKPEGIVIYHIQGGILFKKTFENDAKGKSYGA
jgi:hypothetical protein